MVHIAQVHIILKNKDYLHKLLELDNSFHIVPLKNKREE